MRARVCLSAPLPCLILPSVLSGVLLSSGCLVVSGDEETGEAATMTTSATGSSATGASATGVESSSSSGETDGEASADDGSTSATATDDTTSATATDDTTATATDDTTATATDDTTATDTDGMCANGPLSAPIPNCEPPVAPSSGDFGQDCVDRINQFRWECQCLPPLDRWYDAEMCTDTQSATDQSTNTPHGDFGSCNENAQNTCPNWGSTEQVVDGCLQLMWDEGPGEPFSEHGHYINMSSLNYSKVACGYSSSGQGVWSNQNFAP